MLLIIESFRLVLCVIQLAAFLINLIDLFRVVAISLLETLAYFRRATLYLNFKSIFAIEKRV